MLELLKSFLTLVRPSEGLLQRLEEGQAFIRGFRNKPVECYYPSCEFLDFLHGLGRRHI